MTAQQLGDRVRIHGDDGTVLSLEDRHILQMVADSGAIWVRPGLPVEVPSEYVIQWVDGHRKLTVQLPPAIGCVYSVSSSQALPLKKNE